MAICPERSGFAAICKINMPNKKSAKKELRKSIFRQKANQKIKDDLKLLIKKGRKAIETKESQAKDLVQETIKKLDKAAKKGVIKKNTANRKKSRLTKRLNKALKV